MRTIATMLTLVLPVFALAEGSEHHSNGVPTVVLWQAINLSILFAALIYLTKDKIVAIFKERHASYLAKAEKSKHARLEAEKILVDISEKLRKLRSTADESIARAEAESVEMRNKIISESQQISSRIKKEAESTVQAETEKAIQELRNTIAKDAIESARQVLSKDIGNNDHQQLQEQFSKKVEAVHP